jgi:uncharacterized protein (DUF885 family)
MHALNRRTLLAASAAAALAGCATGRESATAPPVPAPTGSAPNGPRAVAETARLSAFFTEAYEATLARSPQGQTALGRTTNLDQWDDVSPAFARATLDLRRRQVTAMRAGFDPARLTAEGRLSFRLFEAFFARDEAAFRFRELAYPFNQMFGAQSTLPAFLINQHRVTDIASAEAYVARLNGLEARLGQSVEQFRAAAARGVRPPRFVYPMVVRDARNILTGAPFDAGTDSPLLADFRKKLSALGLAEPARSRLDAAAMAALQGPVRRGFEAVITALEADLPNATDDAGVWKHPDGAAYYAERLKNFTTTTRSAADIHALGLSEVARIHREMNAIRDQVGFEGTLKDFFGYMRTDPQFYYPNTEGGRARYLAEATRLIDVMRGRLPEQFGRLPKAPIEVRRVEAFRERSAGKAFYNAPAIDGSRPGIYYANLFDMNEMPIYQMEALAYHEGIPGHHMQIAIAQELDGVPEFRRFGGATAYIEGWALYTEYLPKEMGFYADPYSDFGRLAMELWRAARLVVDTGLHDLRWTREAAVACLVENTPNPVGDCEKAIERYIVMPGQATAYTVGMLEILRLRTLARQRLGARYDQRAFHDLVLGSGGVPLDVLADLVEGWIAAQV